MTNKLLTLTERNRSSEIKETGSHSAKVTQEQTSAVQRITPFIIGHIFIRSLAVPFKSVLRDTGKGGQGLSHSLGKNCGYSLDVTHAHSFSLCFVEFDLIFDLLSLLIDGKSFAPGAVYKLNIHKKCVGGQTPDSIGGLCRTTPGQGPIARC